MKLTILLPLWVIINLIVSARTYEDDKLNDTISIPLENFQGEVQGDDRTKIGVPAVVHAAAKAMTSLPGRMGGRLSYLWSGEVPDLVNQVSGLTLRDIHAVQKSWAQAYADSSATGAELLRRLFTTYPNTIKFFKFLKNTPENQYQQNPQFKAHVIKLMTALNLAVNNLNQPEMVAAMMNKLGESHARRLIQKEHFYQLKDVIVKMFIELLKLDDATLASWGKTVDFWYKNLFETLNKQDGSR